MTFLFKFEKVSAGNGVFATDSEVNQFKVCTLRSPTEATNLNPANGASMVKPQVTFSWTAPIDPGEDCGTVRRRFGFLLVTVLLTGKWSSVSNPSEGTKGTLLHYFLHFISASSATTCWSVLLASASLCGETWMYMVFLFLLIVPRYHTICYNARIIVFHSL